MSLKNDLEMVKEELNSEEKFFEKAVVTERFIKKYKNLMIGAAVVVAVAVVGNFAYTLKEQNRIESANKAFALLEKNPQDEAAKKELLASSPTLYDAWNYAQAIANANIAELKKLENTKTPILGDLATYEVASQTADEKMLNSYAAKQDAIYKDLAQIESAVLLMQANKIDQAHQKLQMISQNSALYKLAKALLHYGVK